MKLSKYSLKTMLELKNFEPTLKGPLADYGKNYELGLFGRDCIQKNQSKLYDDNGDLYIKVDESKIKTIDGINWI